MKLFNKHVSSLSISFVIVGLQNFKPSLIFYTIIISLLNQKTVALEQQTMLVFTFLVAKVIFLFQKNIILREVKILNPFMVGVFFQ